MTIAEILKENDKSTYYQLMKMAHKHSNIYSDSEFIKRKCKYCVHAKKQNTEYCNIRRLIDGTVGCVEFKAGGGRWQINKT